MRATGREMRYRQENELATSLVNGIDALQRQPTGQGYDSKGVLSVRWSAEQSQTLLVLIDKKRR